MFEKYHPIEASTEISKEVKAKEIEEWNRLVSEAFSKEGVLKPNILKSLEDSNASLRHHFSSFLR